MKKKKDDLVPFFELHPSQYMSSEEQEVVLPSSIKKEKDISDEEKDDLSDKEDNMNKKEDLNKSIGLTSELEYEYEHPSKMLTKEEFQELIRKNKESKRIQKEQEALIKNNELNNKNDKINNNNEINFNKDNKSEDNKAEENKADDNISKLSNEKNITNKNKLSAQINLDNNTKSNVEKKKEKYGIKKYSKRKIYTSDNSDNEDNIINYNHDNNSKENYQSKSNRKSKYIPKEKQMYTLNISENKSKKKIKKEKNTSYVKLFEENNNIIDTGKIISNKFYDQLQKFKLNYKYMNKNGNIILHKKYIYDIKLDNKRVIKLPKNTKKKRIINIYDILTIKILDTGNNTYINIDKKEYKNFKNNDTFEVKKNQTYEIINHSDKFFIFELIIN